jgi:hypothetical protein
MQSEAATSEFLLELGGEWTYREANLCRPEEVGPLLDALTAAWAGLGYSPEDRFGVRLALEEPVDNGPRHGNGGDPSIPAGREPGTGAPPGSRQLTDTPYSVAATFPRLTPVQPRDELQQGRSERGHSRNPGLSVFPSGQPF